MSDGERVHVPRPAPEGADIDKVERDGPSQLESNQELLIRQAVGAARCVRSTYHASSSFIWPAVATSTA
ncbi:hypothetical protein HaLaN_01482, partial [Haematococcus lacustris]